MDTIKTFKRNNQELEVGSFDSDKEIELYIRNDGQTSASIWLSKTQANELITHLASRLRAINEPIDILGKE